MISPKKVGILLLNLNFKRLSKYQQALICLSTSASLLQDTFTCVSETDNSWVEKARMNLKWIKKTITQSIARIYEGFGIIFDKVSKTINKTLFTISKWTISLKDKLIEQIRNLSEGFFELVNNIFSFLLDWISNLRQIARKKEFSLNKVTITIEPLSFKDIKILDFSIPFPILQLPKIEMEFI